MSDERLPIFDQVEHGRILAAARDLAEDAAGWFHPHHRASQAPGSQPVTVSLSPPKENTVSLITDVETGYAAVKNELAKFEQALPGALETAKKFEGSPFAALVEKAASAVLPAEAVASVVRVASATLDELIGLYNPQGAQAAPAAPAQ